MTLICRPIFLWKFITKTWLLLLDIAMKTPIWGSSMSIWQMETWHSICQVLIMLMNYHYLVGSIFLYDKSLYSGDLFLGVVSADKNSSFLSWETRLKIAMDSAQGQQVNICFSLSLSLCLCLWCNWTIVFEIELSILKD